MKRFNIGFFCALLFGVFAVSSFAQTTTGVVAVIDPYAFADDKAGITRYVAAAKKLDAEFKTEDDTLTALATRINNLNKEIQTLSSAATPVPTQIQPKVEERDNLQREYKFKEENRNQRFQTRGLQIMGPINKEIGEALQEYASKKGYSMILDGSRLDQAGLLLAFDPKYNATKDFIVFFNARPAAGASVPAAGGVK